MRKTLHRIIASWMGLVLSLALFVPSALAADEPAVVLPVRITAEGTLPKTEETYVVRITAGDASTPMPNGQTGGTYKLAIAGLKEAKFPAIVYDGVGIYTYTIEQIAGTYPDCKYDSRVYTMTVTVTNAEAGGYNAAVALRENGKTAKLSSVAFHNRYKELPKPTTPPGKVTPTGVSDDWILYLIGSAALLCAAGFIINALRRKGEN